MDTLNKLNRRFLSHRLHFGATPIANTNKNTPINILFFFMITLPFILSNFAVLFTELIFRM